MPTNLRLGCHLLAPRPAVTPSVFDTQSSNLTRRLQNTCNLSVETHNLSRPRWQPLQAARCARTHVNGQSPKDLASLMFEVRRLILIHHSARRQVHGLYWNDIPKAHPHREGSNSLSESRLVIPFIISVFIVVAREIGVPGRTLTAYKSSNMIG